MAMAMAMSSISSLPRPAASKPPFIRLSPVSYLLPLSLSSKRRKFSAMAAVETTSSIKSADCILVKSPSHPTYDLKAVIALALAEDAGDLGQGQLLLNNNKENKNDAFWRSCALSAGLSSWLGFCQVAQSSIGNKTNMVYETSELFELGIQLSYLLILLGLLGLGTFYVIRQVLVRRELDLSAKELQEQVRSGDATATGYFELGAVMLRRKFYPAAIKYLQQAIEKWDRDDQDLAQVYNALGVCYVRENKLEKGIAQFDAAVKLQPGYITAWNNLGDAYEKKKDLRSALKAFEEALLFDPNNKVARPRRDALRERLLLFKGVPIKSEEQ